MTLSGKKTKSIIKKILFYLLVAVIVVVTLFPIYWVITTSFKYQRDFMSSPPIYFATEYTFDHYVKAFKLWNAWPYIINSLIISLSSTGVILLLSIPAAYAIAKYRSGGAKFKIWLTVLRMLPPVVLVIPLFLMLNKIGIIDTYPGMVLPYLVFNVPFAILMLVGFFADIPPSLQEAALVDGCTEMKAMRKIVLPLLLPGIVVVILFCFVYVWNDLLIAVALTRQNTQTIMLLVTASMQQLTGTYFGNAAAMASFAIVPIFIITLFTQKYLVRGLTLGGVKG